MINSKAHCIKITVISLSVKSWRVHLLSQMPITRKGSSGSSKISEMSIENKIDQLITKIDTNSAQIISKVESNASLIKTINDKLENLTAKVITVEQECTKNSSKICTISADLDSLEQYTRRCNLRIYGIRESQAENTDNLVLDLVKNKLNVQLTLNDIDRSHRVGKPQINRNRAIIVKFCSYRDKQLIFSNKKMLKGSGIIIREDMTHIRQNIVTEAIKMFGIAKIWTRDGKIFCDKEGTVHVVTKMEQLLALK